MIDKDGPLQIGQDYHWGLLTNRSDYWCTIETS